MARDSEWDNRDMAPIQLQGAVNVRDVGGLPTVDGGETVYRRLLRSENLQELTEEDIALLVDEIGVTTVVDLRSTRELMTEGPAPLDAVDGVQHAHHPVLKEFLDASDTVAAALLLTAQQEDADRYPDDLMCGHYLGYLENRPEEVVGALRSIITAPGAAIVHCAAGKDRTGVVVALALTVAGVEPEVIVADYVATNERIEAIIERLSRSKMYGGDVTSARSAPTRRARRPCGRSSSRSTSATAASRSGWPTTASPPTRPRSCATGSGSRDAMVRACLVDVYDTILKSFFIDRVTTLVEPLGVNVEDWLAEFEKTREDRDRGKITTADSFARALRGCGIEPAAAWSTT